MSLRSGQASTRQISWNRHKFIDLIEKFEDQKRALIKDANVRQANLPLKYLSQHAHFITPASDYEMLKQAIEVGLGAVPAFLTKFDISLAQLGDTLGIETQVLEEALSGPPLPPLVIVNEEYAPTMRPDVVEPGRENARRIFHEANSGRTLRFYRPCGVHVEYCVEDMVSVMTQVGQGLRPERYPIDGIILPKLEHPSQIQWVCDLLNAIEAKLGLEPNQIKLQFLVESGWAVANLAELTRICIQRLAGIILGIADYSAGVMLPQIRNDHPLCDWVRAAVINMAGAAGVPSIDNMTVNYPVTDANLPPQENKQRILLRLKECYEDAMHGAALGMDGKWVSHPAQLFMVRLAYRHALSTEEIANQIEKIEAYRRAVENEHGATIDKGVVSDRAIDRDARKKLRKAVAIGRLDPQKAFELGIISQAELTQATQS